MDTWSRRVLTTATYVCAALITLTGVPAILMSSDRLTFLHWLNAVLDLVGAR